MNLVNVASVALQGIQQAGDRVQVAAQRLSQTAGGGGGDIVDLSAEMVALMQAKNFNSAMVSLVKTAEEMDSHIVNLFA
jgi:hypothetical protein